MRKLVFINCLGDTFTPTHSGAIGTWIWELCRCAERRGVEPLVISKTYGVEPYAWANKVLLEYPHPPAIKGVHHLYKLKQRMQGWGHICQDAYLKRVEDVLRERRMEEASLVCSNDPELTVALRDRFPKAFLHHNALNCNPCSGRFRRRFAAAAHLATAVSDATARWNEEYFGFPGGGIKTLYNGVDCDRFTPAAEPPDGPITINFVGRTERDKGPDLLLKAALKIAGRTEPFRLQILGSNRWGFVEMDDYQRELQRLVCEVEAAGVPVHAPGFVDRWRLPDALREAHIHVVPSRWDEPFALATLEGMACGLATVASRTGGTPEAIGDAGFLFDRDDVEGLAAHLRCLIGNPELRTAFGLKARARAEQFQWDAIWDRLVSLQEA